MVSGLKGEVLRNKVDPCTKCGKRVKANSVMCTKCDKWVHGRCAKMKSATEDDVKASEKKFCTDWIEKGICH